MYRDTARDAYQWSNKQKHKNSRKNERRINIRIKKSFKEKKKLQIFEQL